MSGRFCVEDVAEIADVENKISVTLASRLYFDYKTISMNIYLMMYINIYHSSMSAFHACLG